MLLSSQPAGHQTLCSEHSEKAAGWEQFFGRSAYLRCAVLLCAPVPAAARRLDADAVAGLQCPRALGVDRFGAAIAAQDHVLAGLPVCAAAQAVGRAPASVCEQ